MKTWIAAAVFVCIAGLLLFIPKASSAQADAIAPTFCPNIADAYYREGLFPRFTSVENRLVLADWTTGQDVVTLAETLPYTFLFSWSPDCHYITGQSIGYNHCNPGLIIWNAVTGEQIFSPEYGFCDRLYTDYARTFWNAENTVVLVSEWYESASYQGSCCQRFLLTPAIQQVLPLDITGVDPNFDQVYWDDSRNWLWSSSDCGAAAFDLVTGVQVGSYENPVGTPPELRDDCYYPTRGVYSRFTFSLDHNYLVVSGQRDQFGYENEAISVYNIATGEGVGVNVERNGAGATALSPDNRYLVMGYEALRVWDLQALPENLEDRLPLYRHAGPLDRVQQVRFVDATTVETTTREGVSRWNIFTGEEVPAS